MSLALLAGDIGGTTTRLSLVRNRGNQLVTLQELTYSNANFSGLVEVVQQFLTEDLSAEVAQDVPQKACFAVAGPVENNTCKITNLPWPQLDGKGLGEALGIEQVQLINDFGAVGYGVLALEQLQDPNHLITLQQGEPDRTAPLGIIGAGTGLGEAIVVGDRVYATEGGHADFAPQTDREFALLSYLAKDLNLSHVSVERVVSGPGIVGIYRFLRDQPGSEVRSPVNATDTTETIAAQIQAWEQGAAMDEPPAATIANGALEHQDALSLQTLELFVEAYGAEAGNFALKLLPRRGLYIAGGIALKILPLIREDDRFLKAFLNKGRMRPLLQKIPIHLIAYPEIGLLGAAHYAAHAHAIGDPL